MGKQKFDRMKTILGILMLVFAVVPSTAVSVTAAGGSGGHGDHGHGGHAGWGGPWGWILPTCPLWRWRR